MRSDRMAMSMGSLTRDAPVDLPQHAEQDGRVVGSDCHALQDIAKTSHGAGSVGAFVVAAFPEDRVQPFGDRFDMTGDRGAPGGKRLGGELVAPDEFIERDGDGLPEVHGGVFRPRRNAHQPMAVAHRFVGQAIFLGTEEDGRTASVGEQMPSPSLQAMKRLIRFAVIAARGANDQRAIGDGVGDGLEHTNRLHYHRGVDGRLRFAEGDVVGLHQAEIEEPEVTHGARRRTDIEWIARVHQHHAELRERVGSFRQPLL